MKPGNSAESKRVSADIVIPQSRAESLDRSLLIGENSQLSLKLVNGLLAGRRIAVFLGDVKPQRPKVGVYIQNDRCRTEPDMFGGVSLRGGEPWTGKNEYRKRNYKVEC
jgi:hypothetical protein